MKARITLITLGVDDLARSLAFYRDGLGFPTKALSGDRVPSMEEVRLSTLLAWVAATLLGALGWWAGALEGMFTAFVLSMVGTGIGLYLGRRMAAHLLD
jgi:catechol 2,3-dioxygenase-like lactoylglutathione lyase family enzyme